MANRGHHRNLKKCKLYKDEHRDIKNRDKRMKKRIKGLKGGEKNYEMILTKEGLYNIKLKEKKASW